MNCPSCNKPVEEIMANGEPETCGECWSDMVKAHAPVGSRSVVDSAESDDLFLTDFMGRGGDERCKYERNKN